MADFCKQCSIELFGKDFGELANLGKGRELEPDHGWLVLCEGCGPIYVDEEGNCLSVDCEGDHRKQL
jgi:hypothetical protein